MQCNSKAKPRTPKHDPHKSPQTRVRGGITREPGRGPTISPTWASAAGADVPSQAGHRSHFVLRLHRASRLFLRTVTFTALLCHCPPPGAFPTPLRRHRDAAAAAAVTGQLTLRAPGQLPSCWDWGPLVPSPGLGTQRKAGRGAESCALVPNYTKTTCTNWLKSTCNTRISRSTSGRRAL